MTTLRATIDGLAERLVPHMTIDETAAMRRALRIAAIEAGRVERLADDIVADSRADAQPPPSIPAPVVVSLSDFRREARS